jgi:cation transport ATPase
MGDRRRGVGVRPISLARATLTAIRRDLAWAFGYNVTAGKNCVP